MKKIVEELIDKMTFCKVTKDLVNNPPSNLRFADPCESSSDYSSESSST